MKAKIIATFGPSIMDEGRLTEIRDIGIKNFRFNTAHMNPGDMGKYIDLLNRIFGNRNKFSVMIDLKGPELRTNEFKDGYFQFETGKEYWLGDGCDVSLNNNTVLDYLEPGVLIYLSDGKIKLYVEKTGINKVLVSAIEGGKVRSHSRVNIPGVKLKLGSLTDRDISFVEEGIRNNVDFFALSFTQDEEDVKKLRDLIYELKGRQLIISKIETSSGVKNSYSISKYSDFVMIARGDLGVELPLNEVAVLQKTITRDVKRSGKQVILATQILESMVSNGEPTRAEISDITNAIYDGVDAFLLTDETAIGNHPVDALRYLSTTIEYSEKFSQITFDVENTFSNPISFSVAKSAKIMSDSLGIDVLAFTKNGSTIKILSSLRIKNRIYGITFDPDIYRWMHLYHNITPILVQFKENGTIGDYINDISRELGSPNGTKYVIVSGEDYFIFGGTNDVKIHIIGEFLGRGNYSGETFCGEFGKDIVVYDEHNEIRNAKVVLFKDIAPFKLIESLRSKNISVATTFNFSKYPEKGKKVCLDSETGILYYL